MATLREPTPPPPNQSPPHPLLFLFLRLDLDRITQRISTSLVVASLSLRCNDMFHAIFIVAWATNKNRGINKLILFNHLAFCNAPQSI